MIFAVVANHHGQHSIWPLNRPSVPEGWEAVGFEGGEEECLDHIAGVWGPSYSRLSSGTRGRSSTGSLAESVSAVASGTPDSTALRWNGEATTYRELDQAADRLAHRLAGRGVRAGDVIPVRLPRSPGLVAALLALLKIGAAYVAVPADWPAARLTKLVTTLDSPLAVDHEADPTAWPCASLPLPPVIEAPDTGAAEPPAAGDWGVTDGEDPACVFFTSGSTGDPKGAVCPHRALTGLLRDADFARYDATTVMLQTAALPWDAFALELWGPLLNGGCCVLPNEGPLGPVELKKFIERDGVNTLFLTTSLFNTMLEVFPRAFKGLTQVMTGGERISVPHVRTFREHHPDIPLIHCYGPVEGTVFTTTHRIQDSDLEAGTLDVPIGHPVRGAEVRVLGPDGQPVPPGETGELHVLGTGLCLGYFADPRETARSFVPVAGEPGLSAYRTGDRVRQGADGLLSYVGRVDRQVKLRGVRIEPGEVEAEMREHPGVSESAVVPMRDASGRVVALHGWFTGSDTHAAGLTAHLAGRLPSAWVPSTFGHLEAFPRGHSGKTDMRALEARANRARQRVVGAG